MLLVVLGTAAIGGGSSADAAGAGAAVGKGLLDGAVPAEYVEWVKKAGALCPGESPALIAAQIWAESNFDKNAVGPDTSAGRAKGPAQFTDATWATWGRDEHGDGTPVSPHDVGDAVMAQGRFMCSLMEQARTSGYPGGSDSLALAGYNAGWGAVAKYGGVPPYKETTDYVSKILTKAAVWNVGGGAVVSGTGGGADAVRKAQQYLGVPYVWGGGTPGGPSAGFCSDGNGMLNGSCFAGSHEGFDCSSLVQNAWWATIKLPRVAQDQYDFTSAHPVALNALQPGDLIFYRQSNYGGITHVAMFYGDGKIIQAPKTGGVVEIVPLYTNGFAGATRPA